MPKRTNPPAGGQSAVAVGTARNSSSGDGARAGRTGRGVSAPGRNDPVRLDRQARLIGGLLALTLSFVAYANVFNNPFVYDDHETVVANPSLVDVTNVRFVLVHSPFRPVVNVSYAIDRAIWGYRPFGFHLTNVLLHGVVVALLYAFILRALSDARVRTHGGTVDWRDPGRFDAWAACAGASIFGVHPLMTESVAYVSGRSELLVAAFFMCAVLCGRAAMVAPLHKNVERRRVRLVRATLGAILFGFMALFSKENAACLPLVLSLYDYLVLPGTSEGRRWRLKRVFLPASLLVAAGAIVRYVFFPPPLSVSGSAPGLSLLTQSIVIWRYLGLLFWPAGQSIMHGVHRVQSVWDPRAITAIVAFVALVAASLALRRAAPLVPFGVIWFFATIAPSSSVFALREGMAEHRVYLASIGVVVALSRLGMRLFAYVAQGRKTVPIGYATAVVLLAAFLSSLTLERNVVWSSPLYLWAEAIEQSPGMWEPRYALGDVLRQAGRCKDAIPHYRVVVQMRPSHRDAFTNLGICLAQAGQLQEAERALKRTIEIDPAFARAYTNLGALSILSGNTDAARDYYLQAITIDNRNVLARMQLARLYETAYHDYHTAARMCGEVRAISPATPGVVECVERNQRQAAARDAGR